jgi:hypothetical protein
MVLDKDDAMVPPVGLEVRSDDIVVDGERDSADLD